MTRSLKLPLLCSALTVLALGATPAQAQSNVIDLTRGITAAPGSPAFFIVENDFTLPTGFTNAVLTISQLEIDDRGVVLLNGGIVDNAGIFGPGAGSLVLTAGGPNDPFTFTRGNGLRDVAITSGFVTGLNSFRIVVNDTSAGIGGNVLPGGVFLAGGGIRANVRFDSPGSAVPEPATWATMLLGFGAVGSAMRRRRPQPALA